jgi:hypothetical protein
MNEKELAELTISRVRQDIEDAFGRLAYDRRFYTGDLENHNAVHDRFKSCLIHKKDANKYVEELLKLDPSYNKAVFVAAQDYPELKIDLTQIKIELAFEKING